VFGNRRVPKVSLAALDQATKLVNPKPQRFMQARFFDDLHCSRKSGHLPEPLRRRDAGQPASMMAKALKGLQKELGSIRAEMVNRKIGNVIVLNILILFTSNYRYAKI